MCFCCPGSFWSRLLRWARNVVLDWSVVDGREPRIGALRFGSVLGRVVDDRGIVATAQHDGLALATFGLGQSLQAGLGCLGVGGRNLAYGFADHFVPACRAYGTTGLVPSARASIEVCRRLLVAQQFRQEAHIVQ